MASARLRRTARIVAVTLALLAGGLALALRLLFPWGPIAGLAVENARRTAAPPRIVVTFSTPVSLQAVLQRKHAGFINATLVDCRSGDPRATEVAAQHAGYFPDTGRVRRLRAPTDRPTGRSLYQASFDAVAGDGLCFTLDGGSMWAGKLWSDQIPLPPS